jgi:DNA-directed RNA polymerase specialized sigma24 family protein
MGRDEEDARHQPGLDPACTEPCASCVGLCEKAGSPALPTEPGPSIPSDGELQAADLGWDIFADSPSEDGSEEHAEAGGFEPLSEEYVASLERSICDHDYDGAYQRGTTASPARHEADRLLIESLARGGFAGPRQIRFEAELAAYGYPVMMALTRTGEIMKRVAEMGRPLGVRDTILRWSRDDRSELCLETVARALVFFRTKVLIPGKWNPTRGTTVKTYFIGACLFQFTNVFQQWDRERLRWRNKHVVILDDPDDPAGLGEMSGTEDPAQAVLMNQQVDQILTELADRDPTLHRVAQLRLEGYSDVDAAKQVGLSPRAVEGRWYRFNKHLRRRHDRGWTE